MAGMIKARALLIAAAIGLGCGETPPKDEPAPKAEPPAPKPQPSDPPAVDPRDAERRQAAIDLLTDGKSAALLPIDATDPNEKFDPRLADKLAPKVWVPD